MTMTREELKGRQTPGQCEVTDDGRIWGGLDFGDMIADVWIDEHANAALYAEAHNVANRTGMWPEDLEARVKELEQALKQAKAMMNEARSLADAGGKWDALHAPGTLEQGIREIDATLNKPTP